MTRRRVGTVAYLNAAPLTTHLDPAKYEVVANHPRGIAAALASGEVDVALAPVAAVLTDGDFAVVPGVCIGAYGPVASVVIAAETPPEAWTELVLDGSSRTSVVLAQLIVGQGPLSSRVRPELVVTQGAPGDGPRRVGGTVAAVVIGDPARQLPPTLERWDLAELWRQWTGHPFVFAVWAARDGLPDEVRRDLVDAGRRGVAAVAERWSGDDLAYLTQNLRYDLDDAALIGLRRFAALAHAAGLVGTDVVRLLGPGEVRRARRAELDTWLGDAVDGALLSAEQLRVLLREGSPMDLGVAAHLKRSALHGATTATYLVEHRLPADVVRPGGEAFFAALIAARDAGATAVRLHGLAGLPALDRRERLAAAVAAGLQPWGPTVHDDLDPWADGDLAALRWPVLGRTPLAPGMPIHAELDVTADTEALIDAIAAIRAGRDAVTSVSVRLGLPVGALVEPGRPTAARWLATLALVRLGTDVRHVVAAPSSQGLDACQGALLLGADDLGAVGVGELDTIGEVFDTSVDEAERHLRAAGLEATRRDLAFRPVGGALTAARRVRPVAERARGHA